jgi:hypothetical protein
MFMQKSALVGRQAYSSLGRCENALEPDIQLLQCCLCFAGDVVEIDELLGNP